MQPCSRRRLQNFFFLRVACQDCQHDAHISAMPWWYDMLANVWVATPVGRQNRPWKAAWGRLEEGVALVFVLCLCLIFLNLNSRNCRIFFSQQVSTLSKTEISACCTICRNWAISPRFKLTWRIRAWQQRRRWNCYRRWWTWSGLQNIYGKPFEWILLSMQRTISSLKWW